MGVPFDIGVGHHTLVTFPRCTSPVDLRRSAPRSVARLVRSPAPWNSTTYRAAGVLEPGGAVVGAHAGAHGARCGTQVRVGEHRRIAQRLGKWRQQRLGPLGSQLGARAVRGGRLPSWRSEARPNGPDTCPHVSSTPPPSHRTCLPPDGRAGSSERGPSPRVTGRTNPDHLPADDQAPDPARRRPGPFQLRLLPSYSLRGFAHGSRADHSMVMGRLVLLLVGPGRWSPDAWHTSRRGVSLPPGSDVTYSDRVHGV